MKGAGHSKLARALPLLASLALAAAVRAGFLWQLSGHPLFKFLRLDEIEYDGYARDLLAYHWALPYVPIHAPGYNYALAVLYRLFDFNLFAPRLFQIALGLGSVVLGHRLGRRLFGPGPALVSALLMGLYWPLIVFEERVLAVSLYLFLYLAAFDLVLLAQARAKIYWWAAAGAMSGLAITVYPPAAPWPLAAGAWLAARTLRTRDTRALLPALVLGAAAALVISPVIVHNHRVSGEWFLMQRNSGFNLFVGNNPDADGSPSARPGASWDAIAALPSDAGIEAADEQDRFYVRRVVEFAREDPGGFLLLLGRKALMIVNRFEGRSTLDPGFQRGLFSVLDLPLPGYGVIMVLALPGFLALRPRRADHQLLLIFGAVNWAAVVGTMVSSRYRMVFTAFLVLLAGAGLREAAGAARVILNNMRTPGPASWRRPALVVALLAAGVVLPRLPVAARYSSAEEWSYLGDAYLGLASRAEAGRCYRRARAEDPTDPGALMGLARLAMLEGDYATAKELLEANAARNPKSAAAWMRLGEFYFRQGDRERAIRVMEDAVKLRPQWVIGLYILASFYAETGEVERARAILDRIYVLRPAFEPGDNFLKKIGRGPEPKEKSP